MTQKNFSNTPNNLNLKDIFRNFQEKTYLLHSVPRPPPNQTKPSEETRKLQPQMWKTICQICDISSDSERMLKAIKHLSIFQLA